MKAWRVLFGACLAVSSVAQSVTPEQEIDFAARDAERVLNRAVLPGDAFGANEEMQSVLHRLTAAIPDASLTDCRAQLMKGSRPAVFALPNCKVYVSTALYMKLENEAQLATLLARELAHVQLHSAVKQRVASAKRENEAKSFLVVLAALGGSTSSGPANPNYPTVTDATGDLIWRVSVGGYSLELENAADEAGIARFKAAGYSIADAKRALNILTDAAPRLPGHALPLLSSSEYLAARNFAVRRVVAFGPDSATAPSQEHAARAARLLVEQVKVHADAGEYDDARRVLAEHVAAQGESGMTHFLAGELARRQGKASRAAALEAYEKGAKFADAPAKLFLSQGLMLREDGKNDTAALAFKRFLELDPNAVEAPLVRSILGQTTPNPER